MENEEGEDDSGEWVILKGTRQGLTLPEEAAVNSVNEM